MKYIGSVLNIIPAIPFALIAVFHSFMNLAWLVYILYRIQGILKLVEIHSQDQAGFYLIGMLLVGAPLILLSLICFFVLRKQTDGFWKWMKLLMLVNPIVTVVLHVILIVLFKVYSL